MLLFLGELERVIRGERVAVCFLLPCPFRPSPRGIVSALFPRDCGLVELASGAVSVEAKGVIWLVLAIATTTVDGRRSVVGDSGLASTELSRD